MDELVKEYLGPVEANPSLTQEAKAAIAEHVTKFAAFVKAKSKTPAPSEPALEAGTNTESAEAIQAA